MADEERRDESGEQPPAQPPAEQPSQEPSAEEPPAPEEQPLEQAAEQPPAEEGGGPEQPAAADEAAPDEAAGDQAATGDAAAGDEPRDEGPADEAPPAAEPTARVREAPKGEVVPGAELEPIAIEPERELDAEERARLEAEEEERARREAEATAEGDEPVARRGRRVELPTEARIQATGKRKSSVARVVMRRGGGSIEVNDRSLDEYFPRRNLQTLVRQPLLAAGYEDAVDIRVRVHGGGIAGQAGAVRHGIARALTEIEPELRSELKRRGLLTRDARRKERRKAGLKKARKRPQFSKR